MDNKSARCVQSNGAPYALSVALVQLRLAEWFGGERPPPRALELVVAMMARGGGGARGGAHGRDARWPPVQPRGLGRSGDDEGLPDDLMLPGSERRRVGIGSRVHGTCAGISDHRPTAQGGGVGAKTAVAAYAQQENVDPERRNCDDWNNGSGGEGGGSEGGGGGNN